MTVQLSYRALGQLGVIILPKTLWQDEPGIELLTLQSVNNLVYLPELQAAPEKETEVTA